MVLEGLAVPLVTLFDGEGAVDRERNVGFARALCEVGVAHLFVLGSTGEFPSILPGERRPLIEAVIEGAARRADVWVGCGAPSTAQAVAFAREAERLGASALVAVPPYYLRPSLIAIDHYYRAIKAATKVPLLAYNNPALVGYALSPSLLHALAREGVLAGMKDTSGSLDSVTGFLRGAPEGFSVLPGDPPLASAAIERGARGAVMAVANIAPKLCLELVGAARRGDRPRTRELQPLVDRLVEVTKAGPNPSTVKFLITELSGREVGYRPPCEPLSPAEADSVRARLAPVRGALMPFLAK